MRPQHTPTQTSDRPVHRGDPITADFMNRIADHVLKRILVSGGGRVRRIGTHVVIDVDRATVTPPAAGGGTGFFARVTGSGSLGTRQWNYQLEEVEKTAFGYTGWAIKPGGRKSSDGPHPCLNWIEYQHADDLTQLTAVPTGTTVWVIPVTPTTGDPDEWWFQALDYTECPE